MGPGQNTQAPPFSNATRRKVSQLAPVLTRPAGGGTTFMALPTVGLLARLWLNVAGTITPAAGTFNPFGQSAILRNIRLQTNLGTDLFNVSGPGYQYLARPYLDAPYDPLPQSTGRTALSNAALTPNLDTIIPVMINLRDAVGLFMLQNRQAIVTLTVDWEADATISSGGVGTPAITVTPYMEWFTVPADERSYPPLGTLHQIIEQRDTVTGTGSFTKPWPIANLFLQMIHGLGFGSAAAADVFDRIQLRTNFSDFISDTLINFYTMSNPMFRNQQRLFGVIPHDLLSTAGLGVYDQARDVIDSSILTDLATILNVTSVPASPQNVLYSVFRQYVPVV